MYSAKILTSAEMQESLMACLALEGFFGFVVDVPFREANLSTGTHIEDSAQTRTITFFSDRWYSSQALSFLQTKLRGLLILDENSSIECFQVVTEANETAHLIDFPVTRYGRLVHRASGIPIELAEGEVELILDPGLAFGSGLHETTQLCLSILSRLMTSETGPECVLDVGTGSGIVAIASVILGAGRAVALDVDEQALNVAMFNATQNKILNKMEFVKHDILLPPDLKFPIGVNSADITFANLSHEVFAGGISHITELTREGGFIVGTGFLESGVNELKKLIRRRENRLLLKEVHSINDWVALVYERTIN